MASLLVQVRGVMVRAADRRAAAVSYRDGDAEVCDRACRAGARLSRTREAMLAAAHRI